MICSCGRQKEEKALFTSLYYECFRCDVIAKTKTEEQSRWKPRYAQNFIYGINMDGEAAYLRANSSDLLNQLTNIIRGNP